MGYTDAQTSIDNTKSDHKRSQTSNSPIPFNSLNVFKWIDGRLGGTAGVPDHQQTVAYTLTVLCWLQSGLAGLLLIYAYYAAEVFILLHYAAAFIMLLVAAIPFVMLATRQVIPSAWFFCLACSVSVTAICAASAGIDDFIVPVLLLPVFWAVLMLGPTGALWMAALTILEIIFLAWWTVSGNAPGFAVEFDRPQEPTAVVLVIVCLSAGLSGFIMRINERAYETQLVNARKEAQAANLAKSEFIASISHEIRTPLTGMMGMIELLLKEELTPQQKELADTAQSSAKSVRTLISDLLDLSKIEVGELRLLPEPVNVTSLVTDTVKSFIATRGDNENVTIDYSVPDTSLWLLVDPLRLRQVLANYLSNALKFTEHGRIEVQLSKSQLETGEVMLRLEVEDTGAGIAEIDQHRIFERFTQIAENQKASQSGTGLGLAIVSDLARLQNGRVWVESTLGKGSTFFFEAPYRQCLPMDIPILPADDFSGRDEITVLIADDSAGNQRVLTRVLRGLGYSTLSAHDGEEAVELLSRNEIDVILMDVHMPKLKGPEALAKIRAFSTQKSDVAVIGLSADQDEKTIEAWQSAGVDALAQKPIDFASLDLTIRRVALPRSSRAGGEKATG